MFKIDGTYPKCWDDYTTKCEECGGTRGRHLTDYTTKNINCTENSINDGKLAKGLHMEAKTDGISGGVSYTSPSPYIPTSTALKITPKEKVEDLVKEALKVAINKRKSTEDGVVTLTEPKPTVEIPVIENKAPEAKEGQVMFNKLMKFKLKVDFPVTVFKPTDWSEAVREFIPIEDKDYVIVKEHAEAILRAWEMGEKVLIHGPTGAGKSSLVKQLCAITGRPFIRTNCTGDMDSSMIFGQLTAKDGSTHWVDGTVTEAVRQGAVWAWDEWDVTPPEIAMGLQWLLEDEGKLFLKEMPGSSKDKFIEPHSQFRLVAIGNTQGQGDDTGNHAGTAVQNTATLDRFGTCIRIGYLSESVEVKMVLKKFSAIITQPIAEALVKLGNLVRQGHTSNQLSLTMSPRTLLNMCKKVAYGCTMAEAFELVYTNKLGENHQKVAKELYRKIYGTK